MASLTSFSCSVCDEEFTSVSTLHYHQMCLHTTEELSLAILSIRELTVNTSPVAENPTSPSTDCEDKLLRNGLAKYPRFLNSGGNRKSKVDNSENNGNITDNKSDLQKHLGIDKENVPNDVLGKGDSAVKVIEVKIEDDECEEGGEPVRSSLWGAIKTLDGKAVDAPVIKIDKKRKSSRVPKVAASNTDSLGSTENSKASGNEGSNVSSLCRDSESTMGKEKILEKQLKMMNMSSFDDCIELDCSDDSDEDGETYITDVSDDEEKNSECKETESSVQDEIKSNFSDKSQESHSVNSSCIQSKRLRGKILKHRTWYKGGSFPASNLKAPNSSINLSKDLEKCVEGTRSGNMESRNYYSEAIDKPILMSPENLDCPKVLIDSSVQTDNFFFEEVSNSVVKMLEANNGQVVDNARHSHKKVTPKKIISIDKNLKSKVIKQDRSVFDESLIPDADKPSFSAYNKSEMVLLGGEKRFFCQDCAKTYKKRSHLERHKRVHTGERPFICPYCDKGFSVRSILNQHIRIHTGEKPYSCTICAARFPQKSGLMTHMMLHTGKPFKCDQCDKAFVSNHKLVHHLKSHDGDRPHVCDICTSAFFTAGALEDHKTLHSRNRKHVCNKCNASFVHEVYLKIHLATHLLEADCENAIGDIDVGSVSPTGSTSSQSNAEPRNELTLTLDAIDQFCNGETIMMDLSV